jgi:hypothetical protein
MALVNNRVGKPQAYVINGIDAGGAMSMAIQEGYDEIIRGTADGFQAQVVERETQFCRGTLVTQDFVHIADLLTGASGTYVCYERKSGVAEATGYIKHTFTNPIIHDVAMSQKQGSFMTVTAKFECRAATETATIADMHAVLDAQAAPTCTIPILGGYRVVSAVYGTGPGINIHHVTDFDFSITLTLAKACNDGDLAYTAVDAYLDRMQTAGSIGFQDSGVASSKLTSQQLLLASTANLVLTVKQSQGAANKIITIARALILTAGGNSDTTKNYSDYKATFEVSNLLATPLTLAGVNKIITIADAA